MEPRWVWRRGAPAPGKSKPSSMWTVRVLSCASRSPTVAATRTGLGPGGPGPGRGRANTITARIVGAAGPGRVRRASVLPVTVPAVRVRVPAPAPGRSAHRSRPGAILASRGDKIPPCGAPDLVPLTSPFPCEDSCVQEGLDQAKNPFIAGCVGAPGSSGPCGAVPLEARCDIGPRRTHS